MTYPPSGPQGPQDPAGPPGQYGAGPGPYPPAQQSGPPVADSPVTPGPQWGGPGGEQPGVPAQPGPPAFGPGGPPQLQEQPRPGVVLGAAILMFVVAAIGLVSTALTAVNYTSLEVWRYIPPLHLGTSVCLPVLLAIAFLVAAVILLRGSNAGRVIGYIAGGLSILSNIVGIIGQLTAIDRMPETSGIMSMYIGFNVLILLVTVGVIVMLSVPAANAWFRAQGARRRPYNPYAVAPGTFPPPGGPSAPPTPGGPYGAQPPPGGPYGPPPR